MATKTLFSPPRNKPKLSLPQPTVAAGQMMPAIQQIDRPVNLVDDEGNWHGRLGENPNGPEQVTVTPPPGATNDPAGGPEYASGGTLMIGGNRTGGFGDMQEVMPEGGAGNSYTGTIGTGIFSGNWKPPVQQQQSTNSYPATIGTGAFSPQPMPMVGGGVTSVPLQTLNPSAQILQAQQQQLAARRALLNSSKNTLDTRAGTFGPKQNQLTQKGNLIGLQEQQLGMQQGVTQQSQQNEQQRLGELQGIYAASQNIPDLTNVAEARNLYAAEDRRAGKMGVSPAAEVDLPPGANPARLPGVRPKIMSQEDRLREKSGYESPIRDQQLQLAKLAVELQGTDVKRAQLALERAGLTIEQANQLVQQAELQQSYAQLFENESNVNLEEAQQAPFPNAVRSPITGAWLTPEQRDKERIEYQETVTQPYTTQLQGQGSQNAGLTVPQLLNTIPKLTGTVAQNPLYIEPVRRELIRRFLQQGRTQEQAEQAAEAIIQQELVSRKTTGGLTEPGGSAPAAAPTGVPTVTGPTLPAGYIP